MTGVQIDRDTYSVTAEFASAHIDVPVSLEEVRLAVDAALPLWGEALVEFCVDGIWHRPERMRIALEEPVDPLIPLEAHHGESREDYADSHEVR